MNIRERILARPDLDALRQARDITALAVALNENPPMAMVERVKQIEPVMEEVLLPQFVTQEEVAEAMYHPDGTEK